ncbi:exodeoxyribonuclease IX [Pseudoxanthomonas suwonensis]|uniref:Exodeoxyribonuclease IX n=1 Tax=Pseudoxanthomonas suwonensis TaxID=314722 RepID=A0A0E3YZP1_9GAMM|nr:5'-3' exonuclease H3TH domain-containing protein [Pseudoxanthomonas suwonensis]AKC86057.1 exodeoxyribonuclease IX [Pseudoxanthomonas suwonensis]
MTAGDAAVAPGPAAAQPSLHLVDASLYVFRAWHSMPDEFRDAHGWPTNAVHGFARFLLDLLERERPRHIAIAFDEALDSCFRNRIYPAYKANREPAPEELKRQFAHCKALCAALGLAVLADPDYEADDLIGSALYRARPAGYRGIIVSADKDLSQLLGEHDEQWDYARAQRWNAAGVKARHGVHAHQIADYLALTGDAVDNIPGVGGVGAKTAAVLLAHFGSLDALLERVDEVAFLRLRGAAQVAVRLREQREHALLWRQLTTIACDAPLGYDDPVAARAEADPEMLDALAATLRFGPMTRRRLRTAAGLDADGAADAPPSPFPA